MMPSQFLRDRLPVALADRTGFQTVSYTAKGEPTIDELTGEAVAIEAYQADPVDLPALVDLAPSRATREKLGLDIRFDAVLKFARQHLDDAAVTVEIGDAFELPGDVHEYYVTGQPAPYQQVNGEFLGLIVPVQRRGGSR